MDLTYKWTIELIKYEKDESAVHDSKYYCLLCRLFYG